MIVKILIELIDKTHPVPVFVAVPIRISFFFGLHLLFQIFTFSTAFRMILIFKVSWYTSANICWLINKFGWVAWNFLNPIFTQTSSFCNMEHERVFHYVLLSIGLPFLTVAPSTYIYDYVHHGGG